MTRLRQWRFALGLLVAVEFTSSTKANAKAPAGAYGLLSIIPGLGQVVYGNVAEGLTWFGVVVGTVLVPNSNVEQIGFDLWMYNMYDAYRDAAPTGGRWTKNSILTNYIAAYNPLNIADWIGAPIVGAGALAGATRGYPALHTPVKPIVYGFVGLGEEGLFRGFLFPSISLMTDSKWAGAAISSALFAVAHATGGASNLAPGALAERFIMGMLFSWQVDRNKYDLKHNIFAHTWFDIFVDSKGSKITQAGYRFNL